jgi:AmmeMemoRadiSam system protein A
MHAMAELAKRSVERYIRECIIIEPPDPLPPQMQGRAGVFVSLKLHGKLRGCIGTFMPSCKSIGEEIIANAISAAARDPRFEPVQVSELDELSYSVDVLTCPEKVNDISELDPRRYGVVVSSGYRRGLLLPDLEGVDSVEEQLRITKMKAGILPDEDADIFRFEVVRYK